MKKLYRTALFAGVLAFGISACGDDVQIVEPEPTPPPALSATLTPQNANATVGETMTFAVGVSGGDSSQDPSWTCASSNNNVVTVAGSAAGCDVTAVGAGNASITATVTRGNQSTNAGASIVVAAVADSPATVSIQSINMGGTPADIDSIHGQINVVLNVQENDETVNQVDVLVDGEVVASQVFSAAMLAEMAAEADDADLEALGTITLSLNTARYDVDHEAGTATVDFENGAHTISAQVHVDESETPRTATNTIQTVFQNEDLVLIDLETGATGMDAQGLRWHGQGITATYIHVAYSGTEAGSFSSSFEGQPKSGQTVTWTTANLAGVNTTDAGSNLTVSAIVDGEPGPTNTRLIRYDGVAPDITADFDLADQALGTARRCCSNNWVNPEYTFSSGAPTATDLVAAVQGVGGITITYHAGASSLTNAQLAALPAAATPAEAELAASNVNTQYSVVARVADAVNNVTLQRLQSDGGMNPNQTFGIDVNAPTAQALTAPVANRQVNPGAPINIQLTASDDVAGFGANPVAVRYQRHNASGYVCPTGLTGSGTPASNCTRVQQPFSFAAAFPAASDGYWRYQGEVYDQAGNPSGTTTERIFLQDGVAPNVDNVSGTAGSFTAGQDATFSVNATDNVDLRSAQFSFVYNGLAVPFGPAESLGTPWEFDNLTTSATATATVPFIVGVETAPAGVPSGTPDDVDWARFVVSDVANNASTQQNNFVAGSFPAPVSFAAAFPGGATFDNVTAGGNICINDEEDCTGAGNARTRTLTATATGATGSFQNPFSHVFFVFEDPAGVLHYIAADGTASVTDDGVSRTWTWEVTLAGSALIGYNFADTNPVPIHAVGVNMTTGTALISDANASVIILDN